ncbi:MAG: HDOD domain-containing protein [Gammaproteobacteria bacterium]
MKYHSAQEVATEAKVLFSLPDIFLQLSEMIRDPRYSLSDIGDVISKDPALSARLLKVVNSAFYGFESKIDSISRAISIVGVDDFHNLMLATSVADRFASIPCELIDMPSFWLRSVHCAVVAKLLANIGGTVNVERLFLAGLLHDIGSLVLYQLMPNEAAKVLKIIGYNRRRLVTVEREIIGFTHADVGRELLKLWGLPDSVYDVVGNCPSPVLAVDYQTDTCLLWLAVRLIDDKASGSSIEETLDVTAEVVLNKLHLNRVQVECCMEQSEVEFLELFNQFRFENSH